MAPDLMVWGEYQIVGIDAGLGGLRDFARFDVQPDLGVWAGVAGGITSILCVFYICG